MVQLGTTQPQRWNLLAGFQEATRSPEAQSEIRGWAGLAILSLGIAGVFALLLAFSRLPGIQDVFPWPLGFFEKGLIIHVIFSFVIWFLSILGCLISISTHRISAGSPKLLILGRPALWAGYAGSVLLFIPALMDRSEPSLNNYIPVIIDPIYYTGLATLGFSIFLLVIRMIANLTGRQGPLEPVSFGSLIAGLIYLISLLCIGYAYQHLQGDTPSHAFNEDLFWGGGHVLQFCNVAMLMVAWYLLGGMTLKQPLVNPRLFQSSLILLLGLSLFPVSTYALYDMFTATQIEAITDMQYLMAPPSILVAVLAVATIRKVRPLPWQDPALLCLLLSFLVFGLGGILGLFVDGTDTRTPAHYHGMIGGINLAIMGLYFCFFMPLINRSPTPVRKHRVLVHLYAWGQLLQSLGLFLAGGYGTPRKTAGAEQGIAEMGAMMGMYMNGVGALIAIAGGVMFIWIIARSLLRPAM